MNHRVLKVSYVHDNDIISSCHGRERSARVAGPELFQCGHSISDAGPALKQHWGSVPHSMGTHSLSQVVITVMLALMTAQSVIITSRFYSHEALIPRAMYNPYFSSTNLSCLNFIFVIFNKYKLVGNLIF